MDKDFKLYPLALTQPDWNLFTSKIKEATGKSPTEGISGTILDLDSPAAFLACLDLENQPFYHLQNPKNTFNHYSVSFLCFSDKEFLAELCLSFSSSLMIYYKEYKDFNISIITTHMANWYKVIPQALKKESPLFIREFFHQILYHFEQMGFSKIWLKYDRLLLADGSIILK